MDLTRYLDKDEASKDLKQLLIDVFQAQEKLIYTQQEALARLLNENVEQENMINVMMREHVF